MCLIINVFYNNRYLHGFTNMEKKLNPGFKKNMNFKIPGQIIELFLKIKTEAVQ